MANDNNRVIIDRSYIDNFSVKKFTEEKNPSDVVVVNYKSEGYFPAPSEEDDYDE